MSTTLTDGEKELLSAALWHDQVPADLIEAVERIIADRLAARDERIDQAVSRAERAAAEDWMFACDVPGCSTRFAAHEELRGGGEPARLEARCRANAEGWRCTETTDLCPQHNSAKGPTETCWRGECRTGCYYIETCTEGEAWA